MVKIGQRLYIASTPLMEYEVIAEIKREKNIQYELKCLDCAHGECRVLISKNSTGELEYIGMTSEDEDSDCRHYYFHKGIYKDSRERAYIYKLQTAILDNEKEERKYVEMIENLKKKRVQLKETQDMYLKKLSSPHENPELLNT